MIALPDVNTLIALAWPNHVHHDAARSWFAMQHGGRLATFDGGIKSLLPRIQQPSVYLIPV